MLLTEESTSCFLENPWRWDNICTFSLRLSVLRSCIPNTLKVRRQENWRLPGYSPAGQADETHFLQQSCSWACLMFIKHNCPHTRRPRQRKETGGAARSHLCLTLSEVSVSLHQPGPEVQPHRDGHNKSAFSIPVTSFMAHKNETKEFTWSTKMLQHIPSSSWLRKRTPLQGKTRHCANKHFSERVILTVIPLSGLHWHT